MFIVIYATRRIYRINVVKRGIHVVWHILSPLNLYKTACVFCSLRAGVYNFWSCTRVRAHVCESMHMCTRAHTRPHPKAAVQTDSTYIRATSPRSTVRLRKQWGAAFPMSVEGAILGWIIAVCTPSAVRLWQAYLGHTESYPGLQPPLACPPTPLASASLPANGNLCSWHSVWCC